MSIITTPLAEAWSAPEPFIVSEAAPPAARDDAWYEAQHEVWRLDLLRENAELPAPLPVCRDCAFPFRAGDTDPYFRSRCATCGCRRLDKLLGRSVRRRGRKATLKAIKHLAH